MQFSHTVKWVLFGCKCMGIQAVHWEELVPDVALWEGAQLVADEQPSFSMHWSSIHEFWEVSACHEEQQQHCQPVASCRFVCLKRCNKTYMHTPAAISSMLSITHTIQKQCSTVSSTMYDLSCATLRATQHAA